MAQMEIEMKQDISMNEMVSLQENFSLFVHNKKNWCIPVPMRISRQVLGFHCCRTAARASSIKL
jgi:hypothetical protein